MLQRIAHAMRRIDQWGELAAAFSPFRVVEAYALTTIRPGGRLPAAHERAQSLALSIERAMGQEPPVLCHNDLLNANFIDDGAAIRIVDWEYAGMGDRFFDFGNFAVNHELGEEEERTLLAEYFGSCTPRDLARLRLMQIMSRSEERRVGKEGRSRG